MSSLTVRDAVLAHALAWGQLAVVEIENDEIKPPSNSLEPWLAVQFAPATEEPITLGEPGQRTYREVGTFFLHVVVPSGTKTRVALTYGESIRNHFAAKQFGGVTTYTADPPATQKGATIQTSGNWFGATVAVDYDFDFTR